MHSHTCSLSDLTKEQLLSLALCDNACADRPLAASPVSLRHMLRRSSSFITMPGQPRNLAKRNEKYSSNIGKGKPADKAKKDDKVALGPVVLGILLFVVIGSALLQVIQNARAAAGTGAAIYGGN